jgi:hypothetical protein
MRITELNTFRLDPALDPANYSITKTMKDCSKWKAMTYAGDDRYNNNEMTEVGYVMISLTRDTIIPISRGDEHHRGYDLLYDFASGEFTQYYNKKAKRIPLDINPTDYFPMWRDGRSYLYNTSEAKPLMIAAEKFLKYGGPDGIVAMRQDFREQTMHLSDFINANGNNIDVPAGELSPAGKRLFDKFENLALAIRDLGNDPDRIKALPVFKQAADLVQNCIILAYELSLSYTDLQKIIQELALLRKENDVKSLEKIIFGFHGLKNTIHVEMKKSDKWTVDRLQAFWGDLDLAIDLFSRI